MDQVIRAVKFLLLRKVTHGDSQESAEASVLLEAISAELDRNNGQESFAWTKPNLEVSAEEVAPAKR